MRASCLIVMISVLSAQWIVLGKLTVGIAHYGLDKTNNISTTNSEWPRATPVSQSVHAGVESTVQGCAGKAE